MDLKRPFLDKILPSIPISASQHGFRFLLSTSTLFTSLAQYVFEGFNHSKPSLRYLVTAIDTSKGFETVPQTVLISKILATELPPHNKKLLANFLSGMQAFVSYVGGKFKTRIFFNGVPHEAVLSHAFINLFLSDIHVPLITKVNITSYASDIAIVSPAPQL